LPAPEEDEFDGRRFLQRTAGNGYNDHRGAARRLSAVTSRFAAIGSVSSALIPHHDPFCNVAMPEAFVGNAMRLIGLATWFLLTLFVSATSWGSCAREDAGDANLQELAVSADSLNVRSDEPKAPQFITTLGTLRNSGSSCFTNIVVEVKYFDAKGALIDTVTEDLYSVVVPAHQEATFRTINTPARRREDYAAQTVRVVSARATQSVKRPAEKSIDTKIREFTYAFGPVILLIVVWLVFMRLFLRSKKSPQQRSLALLEKQNSILEKQNELLERLATAAETRSKT
jgi:hypothetical protein